MSLPTGQRIDEVIAVTKAPQVQDADPPPIDPHALSALTDAFQPDSKVFVAYEAFQSFFAPVPESQLKLVNVNSVINLPLLLHFDHGGVQAIAILWLVDQGSHAYEPLVAPTGGEYYSTGSSGVPEEGFCASPHRVCMFNTVLEVSPRHSAYQLLVGQTFSSLRLVGTLLGAAPAIDGLTLWSLHRTVQHNRPQSPAKLSDVLRNRSTIDTHTKNPIELLGEFTFPEFPIIISAIVRRDMLAAMCR